MNKHIISLFIAAAAAVAAGCSSESIIGQAVSDSEPSAPDTAAAINMPGGSSMEITVRGYASGSGASQKTALASDGSGVVFASGDMISLFDGAGKNLQLTSSVASDGSYADFTGTLTKIAEKYHILYPYQETATLANGKITTSIPNTQKAIPGTFDPEANISVAICQNRQDFALHNVGALLKISTCEEFDKIVVRSVNEEAIAGNVEISFNSSGIPSASLSGTGFPQIELSPSESGEKIGKGTYYIVMLPCVLEKGIVIEFWLNGAMASDTGIRFQKSFSMERGKGLSCGELTTANGLFFGMVKVGKGKFLMGAQKTDPNMDNYDEDANKDSGDDPESPVHEVTISKDFYIGQVEVTQKLWKSVMGATLTKWLNQNSSLVGDDKPIVGISWEDAQKFITALNGITGKTFRLPTEAEWEYAARGGAAASGYLKYSGSNTIGDVAIYSGSKLSDVASKNPNGLGIYDMSGNAAEWCFDIYDKKFYRNEPSGGWVDPVNTTEDPESSGIQRVIRGGECACGSYPHRCRTAYRMVDWQNSNSLANYGLRLAL